MKFRTVQEAEDEIMADIQVRMFVNDLRQANVMVRRIIFIPLAIPLFVITLIYCWIHLTQNVTAGTYASIRLLCRK